MAIWVQGGAGGAIPVFIPIPGLSETGIPSRSPTKASGRDSSTGRGQLICLDVAWR